MDVDAVRRAVRGLVRKHEVTLTTLGSRQAQLLELAALVLTVEHYRRKGYQVAANNVPGGMFRVKTSSRGYPWRFSWFRIERDGRTFEVYQNLMTQGAYGKDGARYVVDVAVVKEGSIVPPKRAQDWDGLRNQDLVTFMEVKRLVIYPMLLAQFVGIVHEIMPQFLGGRVPRGFWKANHFAPALVSTGYLRATSLSISAPYAARGFRIRIVPNADGEVTNLHFDDDASGPLA